MAILFTVAIAVVLVATGDVGNLAETTVLLLLCVFALVNVAVLVLRRHRVDHEHYRAPTWMPVLGALACLILILPITGRDAAVYARAGVFHRDRHGTVVCQPGLRSERGRNRPSDYDAAGITPNAIRVT